MSLNVIVCIKRTPDTGARVRVSDDGINIDPAGLNFVVNPYDEFAIEAALRLKEAGEATEVAALTLGDGSAAEQLRSVLAMGADRAVLLKGEQGPDGLATARVLAAELGQDDWGLILFGVKAVDDDQQQIGPMVATVLDRACVTAVAGFTLEGDRIVCHREIEGGVEVIEAPLPAVLTITKGVYALRYASLRGIMAAKRKPLELKEAISAPTCLEVTRLELSPERPPGRIVGEGPEAVPELVRLLREEAKVL